MTPTSVAFNKLTFNNLAHRTGTKIAPVRCAKQFIQSHLSATHFKRQKADGIKTVSRWNDSCARALRWPSGNQAEYEQKRDLGHITLKIVAHDEQKRDSGQITLKIFTGSW